MSSRKRGRDAGSQSPASDRLILNVGGDTFYYLSAGYRVVAVEASSDMVCIQWTPRHREADAREARRELAQRTCGGGGVPDDERSNYLRISNERWGL